MAPLLDFNILIMKEQKSADEYLNRIQKELEDAKRNAQNEELISEFKRMLQHHFKQDNQRLRKILTKKERKYLTKVFYLKPYGKTITPHHKLDYQ